MSGNIPCKENKNEQTVYVVYMFDIYCDCPKKSDIDVLGVFSNMSEAEKFRDFEEEQYGEHMYDSRCLGFWISEDIIDEQIKR